MSPSVSIRKFGLGDAPVCESILRRLPDWFGIESSLLMYLRDTERYPTALAEVAGAPAGFVTWHMHFGVTAEIHCLAVLAEHHRHGIGRALVAHAVAAAKAEGARMLQVKTLGPSRPDANYDRTRAFYLALGFIPLEEFPNLWPGNPCLMLAKAI